MIHAIGRSIVILLSLQAGVFPCQSVDKQQPSKTITTNLLIEETQQKVVKIFGSGGSGLHSYQTGFFISEDGMILTVWSHVLDGKIRITTFDGQSHLARIHAVDPILEIAILKIDLKGNRHFQLAENTKLATTGTNVLAFSNPFGIAVEQETVSLMKGMVSGKLQLDAQLGTTKSLIESKVLLLDLVSNNPGAAGGIVVDREGKPIGMLGKELKDSRTGVWLNFAIPTTDLAKSIAKLLNQKNAPQVTPTIASPPDVIRPNFNPSNKRRKISFSKIGIELVPNLAPESQPYIDRVLPNSNASRAGLQRDDLILFVDEKLVRTISELNQITESAKPRLTLTIRRSDQLKEIVIETDGPGREP